VMVFLASHSARYYMSWFIQPKLMMALRAPQRCPVL
jgi:hypothetical protein